MLLAAGGGAMAGALIGTGVGIAAGVGAAEATTAAVTAGGAIEAANTACGGDMCASEVQDAEQTLQEAAPIVENTTQVVNTAGQAAQKANQFWTQTTKFQGQTVYQRPDLFENNATNIARMQDGRPPIGPDGFPVQLHHLLQTMDGPIAEVSQTFHQTYSSIIHINPNTVGSGIDRAAFAIYRASYWIQRAFNLPQ
jgi:hypothetical protein